MILGSTIRPLTLACRALGAMETMDTQAWLDSDEDWVGAGAKTSGRRLAFLWGCFQLFRFSTNPTSTTLTWL